MYRVEQIEPPLHRFTGGGFPAGIAVNGDHAQQRKQLNADPEGSDGDGGTGNQESADQGHTRQLKQPPVGKLPGNAKQHDQQHPRPAVIRLAPLRHQREGRRRQQLQQPVAALPHGLQSQEAQQHGQHHILIDPGPAAEKRQIKGQLRKHRADGKPQDIPPGTVGIMGPLCQQKAVNGKRDPANDPHQQIDSVQRPGAGFGTGIPEPIQNNRRAHMVDQHGNAGNQLQRLLGNSSFFHAPVE